VVEDRGCSAGAALRAVLFCHALSHTDRVSRSFGAPVRQRSGSVAWNWRIDDNVASGQPRQASQFLSPVTWDEVEAEHIRVRDRELCW
jgi:hypothetical protein